TGDIGREYDAYRILYWSGANQMTSNYEPRLAEAEAEQTTAAVRARKLFFQADRLRRFEDAREQALEKYAEPWPIWLNVLVEYPRFRENTNIQEDTYEIELKYSRLLQKENESRLFHPVLIGMTQMAVWPHLPLQPDAACRVEYDRAVTMGDFLR